MAKTTSEEAKDLYIDLITGGDVLFSILKRLKEIKGLKIITDAYQIFAVLPANGDFPSILLTAHTDVKNPLKRLKIDDSGVILGSGADDRAGVAAILLALNGFRDAPRGKIGVLFSNDEEKGCLGAYEFFKNNREPFDYVLSIDGNGKSGGGFYPYYKALGYEVIIPDLSAYEKIPEKNEEGIKVKKGKAVDVGKAYATSLIIRCADYRKLEEYYSEIREKAIIDLTSAENEKVKKKKEFGFLPEERDLTIPEFVTRAYKKEGVDFHCVNSLIGGTDATVAAEYGYKALILNSGVQDAHGENERVDVEDILFNARVLTNIATFDF